MVHPRMMSCPFTASNITTCPTDDITCMERDWMCLLPPHLVCDGTSQCLTDECECVGDDIPVLYCRDNAGCVTLDKVCNGFLDCPLGEDEWACQDVEVMECENLFRFPVSAPLSPGSYCKMIDDSGHAAYCPGALCTRHTTAVDDCFDTMISSIYPVMKLNTTWLQDMCLTTCGIGEEYCGRLFSGDSEMLFQYRCGGTLFSIDVEATCDSHPDCPDMSDEKWCPDRFYCSTSDRMEWVSESVVCDGVKDCADGSDECNSCVRGAFSSDDRVIRSFPLLMLCSVITLTIFLANGYNLVTIDYGPKSEDHVRVERFLKIVLIIHDMAMGVYLVCLLIANFYYYGHYCQEDGFWRASVFCQMLGVVFSLSSHGSLLTVLLMSVTRAYKCIRSFNEGFRRHSVYITTGILLIINIFNATFPLVKRGWVQAIFRTHFAMNHSNPFMTRHTDISHVNTLYNVLVAGNHTDVYDQLDELNNITSDGRLFGYQDLSLYSSTPVCVSDVFSAKRGGMTVYKVIYIGTVTVILILITASYALLVRHLLKSKLQVQQAQEAANAERSRVSGKVALIVGVKLFTWLFATSIMMYSLSTASLVSSSWYEVTAISILPLNSCLNPLFHTDLGKRAVDKTASVVGIMFVRVYLLLEMATSRGAGPEAQRLIKKLASRISTKHKDKYAETDSLILIFIVKLSDFKFIYYQPQHRGQMIEPNVNETHRD
eukprot:sb/3462548/